MEGSTNPQASKAAERCKNMSPNVAERGGHTIGTAVGRLAQVKNSEAEPATTAKGDARAGADAQSFRLLNENST